MSRRRDAALLVAGGILLSAWAVGATALAILGVGVGLAALAARLWVVLVGRGLEVERAPSGAVPLEGEALALDVRIRGRTWLASRIVLRDQVGGLGVREVALRSRGRTRFALESVPRGRYPIGPGTLSLDDPLGLTRVEIPVAAGPVVLVRPRVPIVSALFTETGVRGPGGRRALVRRPSGLDLHGVREYVDGEPLRAVHWPTSARRGALMVRELEDAPRDDVAVVLDAEQTAIVGDAGASSLDDAVRAAAGIVRAHAARGRRSLLVVAGTQVDVHRVRSLGRDWDDALDGLAAVAGADARTLRALVGGPGLLAGIPELVVVTARVELVAAALASRASQGRSSALVAVDAPTYAGHPPSGSSPALLRLAGAGVNVAFVRHGASLVEALGALSARAAAG